MEMLETENDEELAHNKKRDEPEPTIFIIYWYKRFLV
jgi:hypothetical protein